MKVLIDIDCSNAAFEDFPDAEVARILREAADKVSGPKKVGDSFALRDINGNTVGSLRLVPTIDPDTDWVEVANRMEREANRSLGEGHGHFMTNLAEAVRSLAKAMYHADSHNRRRVLVWFGPYLSEAAAGTKVPGLSR
jgi:hypothetical protein